MTPVPDLATPRRPRQGYGIPARARTAIVTVAAAAALLLSAGPLAHASATSAAGPGRSAATTGSGPVSITGTITWTKTDTQTYSVPGSSQDTQTGDFNIDMTGSPGLGQWDVGQSTYDVSDNSQVTNPDPNCPAKLTGTGSASGSFQGAGDAATLGVSSVPGKEWGFEIYVAVPETYTQTSCQGTDTWTDHVNVMPDCFDPNVPGLGGPFTSSNGVGTIQINCSGSMPGISGETITYSATGTLTVRADRYMFILPRSAKTRSQWYQVLFSKHHDHASVDIPIPVGTPYFAITAGTVKYAGGACGTGIKLRGTDGVLYTYCHGSKRLVPSGTKVTPGTELGLTGNTGVSTGPHLHFQITYPAGQLRCPQTLLWDLYALTQPPPDAHTVHTLPTTGCIKPPS